MIARTSSGNVSFPAADGEEDEEEEEEEGGVLRGVSYPPFRFRHGGFSQP
jgi:hypothetical protein